jgi:N6-L-threonylcarbamoyladenine synthase
MVTRRKQAPSPLPAPPRPLLALGLEGSANKLGVGLILHSPPSSSAQGATSAIGDPATVSILSNIRHTYVTPPGEGFLPSDTARHHKRWISEVVEKALQEGGKTMDDVDVVCFTKGVWGYWRTGKASADLVPRLQVLEWALLSRRSLSSPARSP